MTSVEQRNAAKMFADEWAGKGYEKGQSQPFWLSLLEHVLGVSDASQFISFENQVALDHTSFIDGYIEATHVLIEQKSLGKSLTAAIKQSDGTLLSPFQQAQRYSATLPYSKRPRWIVTCNFAEFLIYDMEQPGGQPQSIMLSDLPKEYYRLNFLVDVGDENIKKEMEISIKAGELVGRLYDALLKQYKDPEDPMTLKSLNQLCVRFVFCLYAEDAGIFGKRNMFHDYLRSFKPENLREALKTLFKTLDTKIENRDPYDSPDLLAFPYVNGGLFADENIIIPRFTNEIVALLLHDASEDFDWSDISPTIFGAVFESTLNPETRRAGGMHYTSISNIHKVIDPLFLNELRQELAKIILEPMAKRRDRDLHAFQTKLSGLNFMDPACGSGNFLTETYLCLRRLENEVLLELSRGQISFATEKDNPIQVSIGQFYGIEINDFAVTVARTALWIAESQMLKETEDVLKMDIDFLPLRSYANIHEGNALRMAWEDVIMPCHLNYIMGNPPFVGTKYLCESQREEMDMLFRHEIKRDKLDYVTCWYIKAAEFIQKSNIMVSYVSTNSICQGEHVSVFWKYIIAKYCISINFAYQTFVWSNEAKGQAAVHCVIIGFSREGLENKKKIYTNTGLIECDNISPYLTESKNIIIEKQNHPICDVPEIVRGSQATDDGNYLLNEQEYEDFIKKEPLSKKYIKQFMMGYEFLNGVKRYCIWLVGCNPSDIKNMPLILNRINAVREYRLRSNNADTRKKADTPMLFGQLRIPSSRYIALAKVSSQRRRYVPMGFLTDEVIPGDKLFTIPEGTIYMFGVLMSNIHNAWVRQVAGRLKSDFSYSTLIVYNAFPWPEPTKIEKEIIERTAQGILDARAKYPDASLADLYDPLTMPPELLTAHQKNDKAVMQAYGFPVSMTEEECVAALMNLYQKKVEELNNSL